MDISASAFLNWLLKKPKGVIALQNLVAARLTQTRAQNLDNLRFIVAGEVAAQAKIGTSSDPLSNSTTLFALAQAMELLLCDIETKTRQIAAAQAQNITITVNTVTEAAYPPTSSYRPPLPYDGRGFMYLVNTTSTSFGDPSFPPGIGGGAGSTLLTLSGSIDPEDTTTQAVFSPATPQNTLTPTPISATLAGVNLPPLGGCSGTVAGGVQIVVSGYKPPSSVGTFYPMTLGNPVGTAPYLGLKWDAGAQQFKFVARTEGGAVSEVPINTGDVIFPARLSWSGLGGIFTTGDGKTYTIDPTHTPLVTTGLVGCINQQGNSYLTYVNVSYT